MKKLAALCIVILAIIILGCRVRNSDKAILEKRCDSLYNELNDLKRRLIMMEMEEARLYGNADASPADVKSEAVVRDSANLRSYGKTLKNTYSENKNYLGIWSMEHAKDDYGDPVGSPYVTTELTGELLRANSAIPSLLKVKFFIYPDRVLLKMYEYSGIIPLSGRGTMCMRIKNRNNEEFIITVYNTANGDIIVKDMDKFLKIMLTGGRLMFIVYVPGDGTANSYKFMIENADFLDRTLKKMKQAD